MFSRAFSAFGLERIKMSSASSSNRIKIKSASSDLMKVSLESLVKEREELKEKMEILDLAVIEAREQDQEKRIDGSSGYYRSPYVDLSKDTGPPDSSITLAIRTFRRELGQIFNTFKKRRLLEPAPEAPTMEEEGIGKEFFQGFRNDNDNENDEEALFYNNIYEEFDNWLSTGEERALTLKEKELRRKIDSFVLSTEDINARERGRPPVKTTFEIYLPYIFLCKVLDSLFQGSPIQRFWFLETVARIPYFSYITMIHTYETLGWWRRSTDAKKVHFAEELNEFNHLQVCRDMAISLYSSYISQCLLVHWKVLIFFYHILPYSIISLASSYMTIILISTLFST